MLERQKASLRKHLNEKIVEFVLNHKGEGATSKVQGTKATVSHLNIENRAESYLLTPHTIFSRKTSLVAYENYATIRLKKNGFTVKENPGIARMLLWEIRLLRLKNKPKSRRGGK